MTSPCTVIAGIGHALPATIVTNDELAARLDTTDEWIRTRSGIRQRHIAPPEVSTADLAVEAGAAALRSAGVDTVDLVILATSTPDRPCPASAPGVMSRLGLGRVPAFDLNAVCSGFLYGLSTSVGMLASGQFGTVLLIAVDTFSRLIDDDDRATAFLFGDGAGAVVLRRGGRDEHGAVLDVSIGSDGTQEELIIVPDRKSYFTMQGQTVYREAVASMAEASARAMAAVGWGVEDVDWFVGHQANQRILDAVAKRLGVAADRVVSNLATVGNTAAASIPLALSEAAAEGRFQPGDRMVLAAFGGGATWGSAALTWPDLG
ncbi:MAG: 3-oxoacyl-[acyl-carrier-protein] synthase [Pseudonocardiales bacterium]|nr:3-oxoacyl-[acyl-carrier-protein] synthase [Pseudonocardiales bacterium]